MYQQLNMHLARGLFANNDCRNSAVCIQLLQNPVSMILTSRLVCKAASESTHESRASGSLRGLSSTWPSRRGNCLGLRFRKEESARRGAGTGSRREPNSRRVQSRVSSKAQSLPDDPRTKSFSDLNWFLDESCRVVLSV